MNHIVAYCFQTLRTLSPLGQPVFLGLFILMVLGFLLSNLLGLVFLLLTLGVLAVYTHPPRSVPTGAGLVLAPLDGYITGVTEQCGLPLGLDQNNNQSETFRCITFRQSFRLPRLLRAPVTGVVREIIPITFEPAGAKWLPQGDAWAILFVNDTGEETALVIRGALIPHQITLTLKVGDTITAGDEMGIALFFASSELYVQPNAPMLRTAGQMVRGGETVLQVGSFQQTPHFRTA